MISLGLREGLVNDAFAHVDIGKCTRVAKA